MPPGFTGTLVFVSGPFTLDRLRDEFQRRRNKIAQWDRLIVEDELTVNDGTRPDSVTFQYRTTYDLLNRYMADGAYIQILAPQTVHDWWDATARLGRRRFTFM